MELNTRDCAVEFWGSSDPQERRFCAASTTGDIVRAYDYADH